MKPNLEGYEVVYLRTGEGYFTNKPLVVSTVLGSCVAITMYSNNPRFAGIVHCQLPDCNEYNPTCTGSNCELPFKYVSCAVQKMLEKFQKMKINKSCIEVKIFGGGEIIQNANGIINGNRKDIRVGTQNVNHAMKLFSENSIIVSASDVGGTQGRKIIFKTDTGEVYLNRLKNNG